MVVYSNADIQKFDILEDNKGKGGVYRWVNIATGYSYVGSARNLAVRLRQYYTISFIEREVKKNNSIIYRSLIKNGYSMFMLEILEYCDPDMVIEREQYYIDTLKPEYNILKTAGSLKGFKHSEATERLISETNKNSIVLEEVRLKIAETLSKGVRILVRNNEDGEVQSFVSIRQAAKFIGVQPSHVAKQLREDNFYLGRGYFVYSSKTILEDILKSESYLSAIAKGNGGYTKHTEISRELMRKAHLGNKLSPEMKEKLSLNSKNAKQVLVVNNETLETYEFASITAAVKKLGVDDSYFRKCLKNNRPCKGYTITLKSKDE